MSGGEKPETQGREEAPVALGTGWAFIYGYCGIPALPYVSRLRAMGGDWTKIYLFWNQLEPEAGRYDWSAVDAFCDQLAAPEEGLISLFSSSRWATRVETDLLPPSPAKQAGAYYRLMYELVRRCRGRVRYWQNDAEPNNPVFWSGTKEEFVAQLGVFHRAVKDADPQAVVILGGYDGFFQPPGRPPFPHQQASLEFFDYVLQAGADCYDVFDLRLYGDPYTIPGRVEYMRQRMRAHGLEKPIVCTEYGGPSLFEFPVNRQYLPLVTAWAQAKAGAEAAERVGAQIAGLYRDRDALPPETHMFLLDCPGELEEKYQRMQARGLVMRNLLALAAGVRRTLYWQFLDLRGERDDLMTLMYGKIGMATAGQDGGWRLHPVAHAFAGLAGVMQGAGPVRQIEVPGRPSLYLFEASRGGGEPLYVVWERRDAFHGEDEPEILFAWPWSAPHATAFDALGRHIGVTVAAGEVRLPVSLTPIYLEPVRP